MMVVVLQVRPFLFHCTDCFQYWCCGMERVVPILKAIGAVDKRVQFVRLAHVGDTSSVYVYQI